MAISYARREGGNNSASASTVIHSIRGIADPPWCGAFAADQRVSVWPRTSPFRTATYLTPSRANFHQGGENYEGTRSSYALITRTGANAWTIGSAAGSLNCPWDSASTDNVAGVWDDVTVGRKTVLTFRGYYNLAFAISFQLAP